MYTHNIKNVRKLDGRFPQMQFCFHLLPVLTHSLASLYLPRKDSFTPRALVSNVDFTEDFVGILGKHCGPFNNPDQAVWALSPFHCFHRLPPCIIQNNAILPQLLPSNACPHLPESTIDACLLKMSGECLWVITFFPITSAFPVFST